MKKHQYQGTNKRAFEKQIATKSTLAEKMRLIDIQVSAARGIKSFAETARATLSEEADVIGPSGDKYFIGKRGVSVGLASVLRTNNEDPSMTVCP